jgi:uncharacterized protein YycO
MYMKIYVSLHKAHGFFDKLIKWQTRSEYSHAAILLSENEIVEARGLHGVRQLSEFHFKKNEEIDIYSVEVTDEQAAKITSFVNAQLGKAYDWTMVIRFVTRKQATLGSINRWFCSEIIYAAFEQAGVDLLQQTEPWEVSPGLLSRSPLLKFEKTLKL